MSSNHDEVQKEPKYELSLLNSFFNDKTIETKETDENSPNQSFDKPKQCGIND
jgi:hypothetical protein